MQKRSLIVDKQADNRGVILKAVNTAGMEAVSLEKMGGCLQISAGAEIRSGRRSRPQWRQGRALRRPRSPASGDQSPHSGHSDQ